METRIVIARRSPRCELTQGQGRACMYVGGLLVCVGTCRPCQRFTREGVHLCVATLHCTGGLHMHAPTRSGDQQAGVKSVSN